MRSSITISQGTIFRIQASSILVAVQTPAADSSPTIKLTPIDANIDESEGFVWQPEVVYFIPQKWKIKAESDAIDLEIWRYYR